MRVIGVAAVLVILGCAAAIGVLATTPFRHLDPVSSHLRACAVAELGAVRVMAWIAGEVAGPSFAGGEGPETPAGGGSYRCVLRPAGDLIDLLVRGRFEGAEVVVHWRLDTARPSLEPRARALPVYVSFAPEGSGLSAADLDRAAAEADRAIVSRRAATARFEGLRAELAAAPAKALGQP